MTFISDEYKRQKISVDHLRWSGFKNTSQGRIFKREGFKDVSISVGGSFCYDQSGSEEKKLITNGDLNEIVVPILNKEIQTKNAIT